jgi:nucleotide-binding universal stress UspA family protein
MYSRILVAIDGSEVGERVLEHAISLAQSSQARLMLVHVLSQDHQLCELPNSEIQNTVFSSQPSVSNQQTINQQASQEPHQEPHLEQGHLDVMRSYWGRVMAAGVLADFRLPCGHPGVEICDLAQKWGAELILMGHRSDPNFSLGLPSMSRYVFDHSLCPLLVLPQQVELPNLQANRFAIAAR